MKKITILNHILDKKEKVQLFLILLLIIFTAFIEMLGIASIMPFITLVANPNMIYENDFLNKLYIFLNISNQNNFLFTLGIIVFLLLSISLAIRAFTNYFQIRFVYMLEHTLGKKILENYLYQPYSWFLNNHSSNLVKNILSEVQLVVEKLISPLMILISQSIVVLTLSTLLLIVEPILALSTIMILGTLYFVIYKISSRSLKKFGSESVKANKERYIIVTDAFGAIKNLKAGSLENTYLQHFIKPSETYVKNRIFLGIASQIPRFILEGIILGGMLIVLLYLLRRTGNFENTLPILSLFAFIGYRLTPAMQQIFGAISSLKFAGPALKNLNNSALIPKACKVDKNHTMPFKLEKKISLNCISFFFPNKNKPTIKKISMTVDANSIVGIIGKTGSGKTTLADIILGLLEPQNGLLEVDNILINKSNVQSWQKIIGYVPQDIFLFDKTIGSNITFCDDPDKIDKDNLVFASKVANLHNFIIKELPNGYSTVIGERGVRLSGGQRQRIGLARAIYRRPKLLILDEATSSLDNLTENLIINQIKKLNYKVTIILIAHRLSTVKICDNIYMMDKGEIIANGSYEDLKSKSSLFNEMIDISK